MDRIEVLRSLFDPNGRGLEIGPLHNPVAPKREGFRVEVVDHGTTEEVRAKYAADPAVSPDAIEEVDFVWSTHALVDSLPSGANYDWIVASHVIEHMPDPLGFLVDCEKLLRPGGRVILAVPDCRKCFDALRPVSTADQIIQAHKEQRTRHSPAALFDYAAYHASLNGNPVWTDADIGVPDLAGAPLHGRSLLDRAARTEGYIDAHGWVFSPASFRFVLGNLLELGLTRLKEVAFHGTPSFEFFVSLGTDGAGCPFTLPELAKQRIEEQRYPNAALLADYRRQISELRAQVAALQQSTSWRVTAPLRLAKTALRNRPVIPRVWQRG